MNSTIKNNISILLRNNLNIGKYDKEDFYEITLDIYKLYKENNSLETIEKAVKNHAFVDGFVYPLDLKFIAKEIEKEFNNK